MRALGHPRLRLRVRYATLVPGLQFCLQHQPHNVKRVLLGLGPLLALPFVPIVCRELFPLLHKPLLRSNVPRATLVRMPLILGHHHV